MNDEARKPFEWPEGERGAISLSFDDARKTQVEVGLPIMDAHGVKGTFYVSHYNMNVEPVLSAWKAAVANGHEIGNHSLYHPCSANYGFCADHLLEDYTLDRMEEELLQANDAIEEMLGIVPSTFAYPCGQTFVGRGVDTKSYVPVVAKHFVAGRSAFDEVQNNPAVCDLARAFSIDADGASFDRMKGYLDNAAATGGWLVLMGHEVGESGGQVMNTDTLDALCRYALDPDNCLWLDTVEHIATYIAENRPAT